MILWSELAEVRFLGLSMLSQLRGDSLVRHVRCTCLGKTLPYLAHRLLLFHQAKATTINTARTKLWGRKILLEGVGRYSRKIDTVLPGKHTHRLYNSFKQRKVNILAQLWTGMI